MPTLPNVRLKYDVGLTTFSAPVEPQTFGTAKLPGGEPAVHLEEVSFNVFYPCDATASQKTSFVPWLTRPLHQWVTGYSTFVGRGQWIIWLAVYLFGALLQIPAKENAPILTPKKAGRSSPWPLVLFSHGIAGGKTAYSQLCGKLASEGRVVVAIEHRDGSGPSFSYTGRDGREYQRYYVRLDQLDWKDRPEGPFPLRVEQLKLRHVEVYEIFSKVKGLANGKYTSLRSTLQHKDLEAWKGTFISDSVLLTGHSLGGATSLYILSNPPPSGHSHLPIRKCVVLDPWLEPLPSPGPAPFSAFNHTADNNAGSPAKSFNTPIFFINSEQFTVWKDHFKRLLALVAEWTAAGDKLDPALLTLVRCRHQAFSDFPVLFPGYRPGRRYLDDAHMLTSAFLEGRLRECLDGNSSRLLKELHIDNPDDERRKRIRGNPGDIIVHTLPSLASATDRPSR